MVEAVGHADGDLVPVVERLEPRVRIARPDCPEDVGTPASDLPGCEIVDCARFAVGLCGSTCTGD